MKPVREIRRGFSLRKKSNKLERTLWTGLLADPNYTLEKVRGGDTYKVSRVNKPTSTIKTIGTDADSFDSNVLSTTQVDIVVNKRCVSAFEFEDLGVLMSQLEQSDSEIRNALLADIREQANDYIKSLISPSSSSPDHLVSGCSDLNNTQMAAVRALAVGAKWLSSGEPWYGLVDASYESDLLKDGTLSASNIIGEGLPSPIVEGNFMGKRYGFNLAVDDSLGTDTGYFFLPSFMKVIMGQPQFKISDLHAQKKFGYVISVDMLIGASQMDSKRVIKVYNT